MSRHLERLLQLVERLLQLDEWIRSAQRHTASTLAEAVERSERTVRSDIDFLRDRYQAPIEFSKTRGYYYSDPEWRLPTIMLNQGELFALTLGARMLEAYSESAYTQDLRSAIARLAERLPEQTWVDLQQVAEERILGYGRGAIVREPPELVKIVRDEVDGKNRQYMESENRWVVPFLKG